MDSNFPTVFAGAILCYYIIPVLLRSTIFKPVICKSKRRLDGKVAMVTGANTGLGKVTASDLARRGAHVYLACRSHEKAAAAKQEILEATPHAQLSLLDVDLNSLTSVRNAAHQLIKESNQLNVLVNNAGFASPFHRLKTEDGIEAQMGVNHLAHFVLTRELLPVLKASGTPDEKSRIINVSSMAYGYGGNIDYQQLEDSTFITSRAYGYSKLAQIYFTKYLSKSLADDGEYCIRVSLGVVRPTSLRALSGSALDRLGWGSLASHDHSPLLYLPPTDDNVTVNAVHPGMVKTDMYRYLYTLPWPINLLINMLIYPITYMMLNEWEGCQTQIYAAVNEQMECVSGQYLTACEVSKLDKLALDESEWCKLWYWSCEKSGMSENL